MTAESVHQSNPGSHLFISGDISLVIRTPEPHEWDMYVNMRSKKHTDAKKFLRVCVLFPAQADLARLIDQKPFLRRKIDDLIAGLVAPDSGDLTDSEAQAGAQMVVCDGVEYHLKQPSEQDCDRFEDAAKANYSAAATHFVKACLLYPNLIVFDENNAKKPGLKHILTAHLTAMAGGSIEFTEKK
jgi:hypothetical protein